MKAGAEDVSVAVPQGTRVVADKGHDSYPLRDVEDAGLQPAVPHRGNRKRPSRNDGRRLRRDRLRWRMELTNAWLHRYHGLAVRWSYFSFMYVGLVHLA